MGLKMHRGGKNQSSHSYVCVCVCAQFKESALRKQSLYLKFDPLLKDSPKKAAMDNSICGLSLPRPSLAIRLVALHLVQ